MTLNFRKIKIIFKPYTKADLKNCVASIWRITAAHKRLHRLPNKISVKHCVKGVRIRSYSGPHFPVFGLNTDRYGVSLSIQSKCGKMRTRIIPNTGTFYAVKLKMTYFIKLIFWASINTVWLIENIKSLWMWFSDRNTFSEHVSKCRSELCINTDNTEF